MCRGYFDRRIIRRRSQSKVGEELLKETGLAQVAFVQGFRHFPDVGQQRAVLPGPGKTKTMGTPDQPGFQIGSGRVGQRQKYVGIFQLQVNQQLSGATSLDELLWRGAETRALVDAERLFLYAIGVVLLVVGGLAGWWFGTRDAAAAVKNAQQRVDAERLAGAEQAIRSLHLELLVLLRESLSGDAIRRPVDESLAALEQGDVDGARSRLIRLRDSHAAADATLRALVEAAEKGSTSAPELERRLAVQQAVLGQLCADMAAEAGDPAVARRLLKNAARVDPGRSEYYAGKLRALEEAR